MAQRHLLRNATDTNLAPPLKPPFGQQQKHLQLQQQQQARDRTPRDYDNTLWRQELLLPDNPQQDYSRGPQPVYPVQNPTRYHQSQPHYTTQKPESRPRPLHRQLDTRPVFMNPDLLLDKPHFRHHSGEILSSIDYEAGEDNSSISSMDNPASAAYKLHQQSSSSLGYSLDSQRTLQPRHSLNTSQTLSNLTTPQSSPQTVRGVGTSGNSYHNGHASSSYQYSSGSEGDLDLFSPRQPALLGDLITTTTTTTATTTASINHPLRRNSGIKMSAAKRLPPFNPSRTLMPASAVTEGSAEDDDDNQTQRTISRQQVDRRVDLEDDVVSISLDDDDDYREGGIRDRDMAVTRERGPNRTSESSRFKQSFTGVSSQASPFQPFPPPASRTAASAVSPSASFSTPTRGSHSQLNGAGSSTPRQAEPDRGPADLSNPSTALAEALRIARSKANSTSKAPQRSVSDATQPNATTRSHDQNGGQRGKDGKLPASNSVHSNGSMAPGQIRIPVPDLSPGLRGYASYHGEQQDMRRNPDGLLYPRRCSFTLSPTSSNPESRSDSHSGSLGTPRANTTRDGTTSAKFSNASVRAGGPSISSKYSDDYGQHRQSQHHRRQSSYVRTSFDSAQSGQNHGEDRYSRFVFPGQDHDQTSPPRQSYDDGPTHSSEYPQDTSGVSFQQEYTSHRRFQSSTESVPSNSYQKQRQPGQGAASHPKDTAAAGTAVYDQTHSSHSLGASEDLQDQMETEAEYIMTRNTELLRILSIRDDEIKTLQQELDHSLKVMHEYEDELLKLHTAAAKPYESYHQTLDQIGHEMTQQDAIVKGYQEENEKLREQLKASVELRQEAEKRHLQAVDELKTELVHLRAELDETDVEKYGTTDLRLLLQQAQESQDRARKSSKEKEDEQLAEITDLKERLKFTEKVLEEERKAKVKEMQKLERDIQEFRVGYKGMLAQIQSIDSRDPATHSKGGSSSSSAGADTAVDQDSDIRTTSKGFTNATTSPTPPLSDSQEQKDVRPKTLDRKPTSTETLTTANMANHPGAGKLNLEERLSRFEADIRQSLMRTASIESFHSVRSSNGSGIPMATLVKPSQFLQSGHKHPELRLTGSDDETHLTNALRDRISSLSIENRRLQVELSSLGQVLRLQQAERQRKVAQLEELLDMHEAMANQKLKDADTEEGQGRIRKVIQGLLVRIRTKEAEAEFYHNAYLDKVLELDQLALSNRKADADVEEAGISQATVEGLLVASPSTTSPTTFSGASGIVAILEARVKELERINMETSFRLAAEQRRVVASEAENATLIREKLTLARMLEDQVEQLQSKLSTTEIAKARLEDENSALRQKDTKDQQDQQQQQHQKQSTQKDTTHQAANAESMAIMRTRMLSLTRQRDQLREQLQEAFDIQLAMRDRTAGGVPEWTVDDYKRLERALEEKSSELGVWKDRAIALGRVVERIRMLKDKQEPMGVSMDRRSSTQDSESMSSFSASGGHNERRRASHHTLEELDQVVLRLEQRLERRDQELQEVVLEAKRQTDQRLEAWKAKWVQVVQRKNAEIHRFQVELESLMAAVGRDRARMAASMQQK